MVDRISFIGQRPSAFSRHGREKADKSVNGHRFSIDRFSFPVFKIPEDKSTKMIQ
jgi:hypothetical protein